MAGRELLASHQSLAVCVRRGEVAQGLRDTQSLLDVARRIHELPLAGNASYIGNYYLALALNRGGTSNFPEANRILLEVADRGPGIFRAKAMLAYGTNHNISGDWSTTLEAHAEVTKMSQGYGLAQLHPICCIGIQIAAKMTDDGEHEAALSLLANLYPYVSLLGRDYLPLRHTYYNNLTNALASRGLFEHAKASSRVLLGSPFYRLNPEWGRTCIELDARIKATSPKGLVVIGNATPRPAGAATIVTLPLIHGSSDSAENNGLASPFHRPARVLSIEAWKKKRAASVPAQPKLKLTASQIPLMTTQQKQAAILRFILSDEVTDQALDHVLHAMIGEPPRSEDEPGA